VSADGARPAASGHPTREDSVNTTVIVIIVLSTIALICGGAGFLLLALFVIGLVLLRRRGQQNVTPQEAVAAGAESVSQMFRRGKGGALQPADEDDD
jgi:hypothetical protein